MLEEICPIQFIEGINENAKANEEAYINTMSYASVAISYDPSITYSLAGLNIFLIQAVTDDEPFNFKLSIRTDYSDNPSNIILCHGTWTNNIDYVEKWQEIWMEKPAVVIAGKRYWCVLELNKKRVGLPIAVDEHAISSDLRFESNNRWIIEQRFPTNKVIIRFFGRVLPINTFK
jgi:hypothetical protein